MAERHVRTAHRLERFVYLRVLVPIVYLRVLVLRYTRGYPCDSIALKDPSHTEG